MTLVDYLLVCLMEECGELSQRAGKAIRFGVEEVQPGQPLTNARRLVDEANDVLAILELLKERGMPLPGLGDVAAIEAKKARVRAREADCPSLAPGPPAR